MKPSHEELIRLAIALGGAMLSMTAEESCRGIPGNRYAERKATYERHLGEFLAAVTSLEDQARAETKS